MYKTMELIKTMFSEKFEYFSMDGNKSIYENLKTSHWGKALAILDQWGVIKTLYLRKLPNQN